MIITNDDIMTREEAGDMLGVSKSTVALYIAQGKLKTHKIFGKFPKFKKKNRSGDMVEYGGIKTVLLTKEVDAFILSQCTI